jgi:hypothetical protein
MPRYNACWRRKPPEKLTREPLAGEAASVLFALGVIGVGFLALPIMTTGAAYDL